MTSVRLAYHEFLRLTSGRLPRLALAALLVVPLLYGAMYLYANWDPYSRLDNVPVALVNEDAGAQQSDGKRLRAGQQVVEELTESQGFDWYEVDAEEAAQGVSNGDYTFALTLPRDFSAALGSSADFTVRQGFLELSTNDANNYLVRTIADRVTDQVRRAVAEQVGAKAAERLISGLSTVQDRLQKAAGVANNVATASKQLDNGQQKLLRGTNRAASGAGDLNEGLSAVQEQTAGLPGQTATLSSGANRVADGNERVAETVRRAASANQSFVDSVTGVSDGVEQRLRAEGFSNSEIDTVTSALTDLRGPVDNANNRVQNAATELGTLASGAREVADGANELADSAPTLTDGVNQAAQGAGALDSGLATLRDGQQDAADGTRQLRGGSATLQRDLRSGAEEVPDPGDDARDATARTIGDPVAVRSTNEAGAATYGAGLAPFFLALAAWIGGFVVFLLCKPLSSRAIAAGRSALSVALGGLLTPAAIGVAQMVLLYAVVLAVGMRPANPLGTLGFLIFASISFVALLHGLNALFGPVGKFLGLVLLILQLVTAGGTFPWQTIPAVLYPLNAVLPMGYVVDGLRQLSYGGSFGGVWLDLAVLTAWLFVGVIMAVVAAGRDRIWTPARLQPELVL